MGVVAILTDAVGWAIAGTFLTATLARIDSLSVAALRTAFATLFVLPAMFVLGAQGDLWAMDIDTMWKLAVAGLGAYVLAEPTYALTLSLLGLTRGYTAVIGLYSLFSFLLPALFLDEPIGGRSAAGGVLVIAGVYVVARYGRAMSSAARPEATVPPVRRRLPFRRRIPPIAGGATTAAILLEGVRIPGLGLTLPRLLAGVLLAIVTGLAWAGDATLLRAVSPGFDAAPVALMQLWPAAIVFVVWLSIGRRGRVLPAGLQPRTAALIGVTGALTTGMGTILVVVAVQDIGAGPTAVLFAMSTVFALSLGAIFLKERVTRWGVLGTAVAVGGVALLAI